MLEFKKIYNNVKINKFYKINHKTINMFNVFNIQLYQHSTIFLT